jgi:homoserine kinase
MAAKSGVRLTFKATMANVSVPATSANLGPGFDCAALALDLRDQYVAAVLDEPGIDIDITGEGQDTLKRDKNNLLYKAMHAAFEFMGQQPRGLAIRQLNNIPHGRGLGSSAAAIVGGLNLARSLVLDGDALLTKEDMLQIATQMEGHPDNVSAAIYGGATFSWLDPKSKKYQSILIPVNQKIQALVFIPKTELSTSKARKLLPEEIPFTDAVANSANVAIMSTALSTRPDLLFAATEDFLHQNYRQEAYRTSYELVQFLRGAGVAAMISGAGPSVLALLSDEREINEIFASCSAKFPTFNGEKIGISPIGVA